MGFLFNIIHAAVGKIKDEYFQVFAGVHDSINVSWQELCERLGSLPDAPRFRVPYKVVNNEIHSRFTPGTAQLGMNYGAANQTGKPDSEEVGSILKTAVNAISPGPKLAPANPKDILLLNIPYWFK